MDKPSWWPENPYPKSVFPMVREVYPQIVPNEKERTALSGMLGREFWNIASEDIWKVVETELDKHRWIPVSEEKPKKPDYYDIVRLQGRITGRAYWNGRAWRKTPHYRNIYKITHWKPITLPEK